MEEMRVRYWGVRGSISAPLTTEQIREKEQALIEQILSEGGTEKIFGHDKNAIVIKEEIKEYLRTKPLSISGTYGGNTTCIEVQARDSPRIIIDAGTGIRALGQDLIKNQNFFAASNQKELHLFFTHYHWDHLQGFPFFAPGFIPGKNKSKIFFYGKKDATKQLSDVLAGQQQFPNFPIVWIDMPCDKKYQELGRMESNEINIGLAKINYEELNHPDSVFGYSIEVNGKKFVVATDTEPLRDNDTKLVKLAKGADVMYYDGQYTPEELRHKRQRWGHSTYEAGIDTAIEAGVKTLVLGHHDPERSDFELEALQRSAQGYLEYLLKEGQLIPKGFAIEMAYEGMVQEL